MKVRPKKKDTIACLDVDSSIDVVETELAEDGSD